MAAFEVPIIDIGKLSALGPTLISVPVSAALCLYPGLVCLHVYVLVSHRLPAPVRLRCFWERTGENLLVAQYMSFMTWHTQSYSVSVRERHAHWRYQQGISF